MTTLLVPVDFSSVSNNAAFYAAGLAGQINARILLLHVTPQVKKLTGSVWASVGNRLFEKEEKKLDRLSGLIKKRYGVRCAVILKHGDLLRATQDLLNEKNIGLVVMGSRGSDKSNNVTGRQTKRLIRNAGCAVMAVPARARYTGLDSFVFATGYHTGDVQKIKQLAVFAAKLKAFICVAHVVNRQDFVPEKMILENFIAAVRKKVRYRKLSFRLLTGRTEQALHAFIRYEGAGAVVLSGEHRHFFEKLLGAGLTQKMIWHSSVPVMVLPDQR